MQTERSEKYCILDKLHGKSTSGNGMVSVTASASMKMKSIAFLNEIINPEDISTFNDQMLTSANNVLRLTEKKMINAETNRVSPEHLHMLILIGQD